MTTDGSTPTDIPPRSRRPDWLWLAGGTVTTVVILSAAEYLLPRSTVITVVLRTMMIVGIAVSCIAYWHASRHRAGDCWRAELVGIVAFASLAPVTSRSTSDLIMQGGWLHSTADFLQSVLAIGIGLAVTKWLMNVDARDAAANASRERRA